jgi:hypothetical protein
VGFSPFSAAAPSPQHHEENLMQPTPCTQQTATEPQVLSSLNTIESPGVLGLGEKEEGELSNGELEMASTASDDALRVHGKGGFNAKQLGRKFHPPRGSKNPAHFSVAKPQGMCYFCRNLSGVSNDPFLRPGLGSLPSFKLSKSPYRSPS